MYSMFNHIACLCPSLAAVRKLVVSHVVYHMYTIRCQCLTINHLVAFTPLYYLSINNNGIDQQCKTNSSMMKTLTLDPMRLYFINISKVTKF